VGKAVVVVAVVSRSLERPRRGMPLAVNDYQDEGATREE
jgi:hypothetical protein